MLNKHFKNIDYKDKFKFTTKNLKIHLSALKESFFLNLKSNKKN